MRPCIQCGEQTEGSTGRAGIHWPMLCQKCKDEADATLDKELETMARAWRKFNFIIRRKNLDDEGRN